MLAIAQAISKLEAAGNVYTDVQVQPGQPISYRSPTGYEDLGVTPSAKDVADFAEWVDGQWRKRIEPGQFDATVTLEDRARLRCNFFRYGGAKDADRIGCQIRRQPVDVPELHRLGTPPVLEKLLSQLAKGLILITGPTGSGKSTTQAAMLEYLNRSRPVNIVTIEEPIEYEFHRKKARFIQREVPTNVTTFAEGVVSAKRQDPDVIMIGEMRDRDTADACLQAAYSGHLVIATLHSRSSLEACEAMINFFEAEDPQSKRALLASSLLCVVTQILLPSADGKRNVLACEVLESTPQIAVEIRDGNIRIGQMQAHRGDGYRRLNDHLAGMVREGTISRATARAAAYDKIEFEKMCPA